MKLRRTDREHLQAILSRGSQALTKSTRGLRVRLLRRGLIEERDGAWPVLTDRARRALAES